MFRMAAMACLLVSFVPPWAAAQPVGIGPVDLELVLAADGSGSIDDEELRFQREGYAAAVTSPRVLDAIRSGPLGRIALAFTEWGGADSQHVIVDWMVVEDEPSAAAFAEALVAAPRAASGWNSIGGAIDHAAVLLRTNGIEGLRMVIDVSGDAPHYGGRPVTAARDEAVLAGITINALAIAAPGGGRPGYQAEPLEDNYEREVIGGFGAFVVTADEGTSFRDAVLAKMVREIAGLPGPRVVVASSDPE
ncbi:DUF1194 domain-containing protein [Arenibaculum sp.]|jgi:hypothetical protein|uniref:DUF1194 domain-containing protein n=1 Tax=Arenibaculum sp. TaxID=2865862 RepID=UPI002E0EBFE0|nr:DUF1194 domain-containing protein [Arenibaculum sp.]